MDRHQRQACARRRAAGAVTRLAFAVSLSLLAAGCGGTDYYVRYASSGTPTTGVSSGGTVYVQGSSSGPTYGYVIAILTLGYLLSGGYPEPQAYGFNYPANPPMAWGRNVPVPELEPARSVNEQDCSKPIENWSANLKCK